MTNEVEDEQARVKFVERRVDKVRRALLEQWRLEQRTKASTELREWSKQVVGFKDLIKDKTIGH